MVKKIVTKNVIYNKFKVHKSKRVYFNTKNVGKFTTKLTITKLSVNRLHIRL